MLILHGWGQSGKHWQETEKQLSEKCRAVALDLPAFGSTSPIPGSPEVSDYADFVHAFIKKMKFGSVILVGHSFGGQVAVDLALRYPEEISKLILISPACVRSVKSGLKSRISSALKPVTSKLPKSIQGYLLKFMASSDYQNSNPLQRQVFSRIIRTDYSEKLKNIKPKTFILWGTDDQTIPNTSKFIAETVPQSVLIPLYGVDHNPHLTATTKLAQSIDRCLRD